MGISLQLRGGGLHKLAGSEPLNFCRKTTFPPTRMSQPPHSARRVPPRASELASLPAHQTIRVDHYALPTNVPAEMGRHMLRHIGGKRVRASQRWHPNTASAFQPRSHHDCAYLEWLQLGAHLEWPSVHFEMHFVQQHVKTSGPGITVPQLEDQLTALHRRPPLRGPTSFFANRIGFAVSTLAPFRARLKAWGEPYFDELNSTHTSGAPMRASLLVPLVDGFIVQLIERGRIVAD